MVDSIRASEQGLRIVDQARRKKQWNKTAEAWCIRGFTSRATLSRFWAGQPIRKEIFMSICEAVGANWQDIADWDKAHSVPLIESEATRYVPNFGAEDGQNSKQDWGSAPAVASFYGRTNDLTCLYHWIGQEQCRLVALVGMGGIGKTALAARFARLHHQKFEFVIWRSLRNAPVLEAFLVDLLQFLSASAEMPTPLDGKMLQLLQYLQSHRCLLVIDGVESILQEGYCRAGYEGYGQLFTCIGETQHQSCLMLTSREMPKALAVLEGETLPVRCWQLQGVNWSEGQQIAQMKGSLIGIETDWRVFVERYVGNPLVLKMVASTIRGMFGGNIAYFLTFSQNSAFLMDEVRALLEEHIDDLSRWEQDLLYWLALNDKPLTIEELQEGVAYSLSLGELMQAIATLQRRCLIEIRIDQTTHPTHTSLGLKYTTNSLIQQMSWSLNQGRRIKDMPIKPYSSVHPQHQKNDRMYSIGTTSSELHLPPGNERIPTLA